MSKRIVFAVTNDLSHDRRMHRICDTLAENGWQVTLAGRKLPTSTRLPEYSFVQVRLRCFFHKGPLFYAEFNMRLLWYLLRSNAGCFGACDLDTALAVVFAGKMKGRRITFDAHEHFTEVPEVERRAMIKKIWHRIGRWTIPRFDARYTVGPQLAGLLSAEYGGPFNVVRNVPVFRNLSIVPPAERLRRLVYIGTLNEGRGLEATIEAMKFLPEFELLLIGEGDLSETLRHQVKVSRLSDKVTFAGWVAPHDLHTTIASSWLGLNVLEARSRSYYFSLSNKFFDYMHAGVPSLNMAFPEYMAILEKYPVGIAIAELKVEEIALAVKRLADKPAQYGEMVEQCRATRELFSWDKEQETLITLYGGLQQRRNTT